MIDRTHLRYFLALAEEGNFSRAASKVGVTQPTLSAGIAKLEHILGTRLFDRDTRHVALTPAGSRFLPRARAIAAEYEAALLDLRGLPERRVLRLGLLPTIPTATLSALLAAHAGAGEVLEIIEGSERDLAERLDRGRIDAALSVVRPQHARFSPEILRQEAYLMVLPADHPLSRHDSIAPEELAGEPMVARRHCEALPEISRFFTAHGVRPRFVLKTASDERMMAVIRAGLGVGMMPDGFCCDHDAQGLAFVAVDDFALRRDVGLLFAPTAAARAMDSSPFLSAIRTYFTRLKRAD